MYTTRDRWNDKSDEDKKTIMSRIEHNTETEEIRQVFSSFKSPPTMIGLDTNLSRALIRYY